MKTDEELITAFKNGDTDAFEILVKRYTPRLRSFLAPSPETMDLIQETFNKVFNSINSFNIEKSFKAWIFTIARNCLIDAGRKAGKNFPLLSEDLNPIDRSHDDCPAKSLSAAENRRIVLDALDSLPPKQRQVLEMSYYQSMSYAAIAQELNCSLSTVKTHMSRAVRKLALVLPGGEFR